MRRSISLSAFAGPLRVGVLRALFEGLLGYALVLAVAMAVDGDYRRGALSVLGLLGWIWLAVWPAWRLRPLRRRPWWRRIILGIARVVLCSLLLSGLAVALRNALWPQLMSSSDRGIQVWGATGAAVTWAFLSARVVTVVGVTLYRRGRRRLRWQLTASFLAVIMLTFMTMTALGSVAVLAVVSVGATTQPDAMAASVAYTIGLTGQATPLQRRAQAVLDGIQAGRIEVRGEPPFTAFVLRAQHPRPSQQPRSHVIPRRVLVLRPDGAPIAATVDPDFTAAFHLPAATTPLPSRVWGELRAQTLAGHTTTRTMSATEWTTANNASPASVLLGAAPVLDARGRPVAVVVVEMQDIGLKPNQLLPIALAVFGVSTFVVLLSTSVPVLLLSFIFGLLLARGLTRRLEAVTRVTTAIAAGDLSQRAPVKAADESGRLAESVNLMAASLDRTMTELRGAHAQAEGALRARQELVASISHELRTPLAIVRAHLDNLALRQPVAARSVVDERVYEDEREVVLTEPTLRALRHETERLAVLIDDLFTLSRAETGTLQVRCEPVDVAALVDEVAALMRPLAQNEGQIALTVDARPGLPYARADAGRLRQILENLVRNAVRHTQDGGIIALSVTAGEDGVVMAVADTGEGMAPEHLTRIFDRFYRVDRARTRELGGAGLGLAIVRESVELMGGRVTVESTLGEGSCFRVFLPLAR